MSSLADCEKQLLAEVTRRALTLAVTSRGTLENLPRNLNLLEPGGAFVTLRRHKRLRGCIGQLPSTIPLVQVVAYCAKAAALEDPRFEPVRPDELEEITIEISVLSPLSKIVPDQIEVGKHGLLVKQGERQGVLLPQVATQFGWTGMRFLQETCAKAGLGRDAWKDSGTEIQAFTTETFTETAMGAARPGEIPGEVIA